MNASYIKYNDVGRILFKGEVPESMLELQGTLGVDILRGHADPAKDYVRDGQVLPRPANRTELAGHTLIGLPRPCVIRINGAAYPCDEPVAVLSFPYPATYQISIEAFPYLDAAFTLEQA